MFKYKVKDILKATKGKLIKGDLNQVLKGVSTDTRKLENEDIFIALQGENFDAHNFIDDQLAKEVKAIIVQKEINVDCENIILVENTTKALQDMAKYHRDNFKNVKVIGITGSSGKTSTKDILYELLNIKYKVKKNEGNLNNHIGVPLTLFRLTGKEDFFIVEMGMSQKGEISRLAEIADPQLAIITNIGRAHIEFFNSVEDIAKAKGELIEALDKDDIAVLNYDNEYTSILKDLAKQGLKIKYFGFNNGSDYYIENYKYTDSGMEFKIGTKNGEYNLKTNLFGEHNLYNIVSTVAVARHYNINWDLIKKALKELKLTGLRSEIKKINGVTFINDCYNANPLSMKNAIKMLKEIEGNKKIAVLGDMLELGDIKKEAHLEIGEFVVENKIDLLLTTGKLGKYIAEAAQNKGMQIDKIKHFDNKAKLSQKLKEISYNNDVILLKGSRGMRMEDIYQDFLKDEE